MRHRLRGLAERMARATEPPPAAPTGSFESALEESYEDQNLRRKLSQGFGGRVK
jgi:hypothetical protein